MKTFIVLEHQPEIGVAKWIGIVQGTTLEEAELELNPLLMEVQEQRIYDIILFDDVVNFGHNGMITIREEAEGTRIYAGYFE